MELLLFGMRLLFAGFLYLFLYEALGTIRRDLAAEGGARLSEGSPAACLLVKGSTVLPRGVEIRLDGYTSTVGRSPGNDIVLRDPFVSVKHARFERRDDSVWVVDLGSSNGTFVNGRRIRKPRRLRRGDRVEIGETTFEFKG